MRVPDFFLSSMRQDPRVVDTWAELDGWHGETTRSFTGYAGTNPFQTWRYAEAMG